MIWGDLDDDRFEHYNCVVPMQVAVRSKGVMSFGDQDCDIASVEQVRVSPVTLT